MTPDEELVRRLLADARADEPMPADVVARLDGVLDDLATERRPVTSLRRRRDVRRRRWLTGLAAAAAVAVGGITLQSVRPAGTGMSDSFSAGSEAESRAESDSGGGSERASEEVGELHRATLAVDVRRVVRRLSTPSPALVSPLNPDPAPFVCAVAEWGPGRTAPVRLDGREAMLVLRPSVAGRRTAQVLECGSARVLASVRLPSR